MANYTQNTLIAHGLNALEHSALADAFAGNNFFETFIKPPAQPALVVKGKLVPIALENWRIQNWGVKWDISGAEILAHTMDDKQEAESLKCIFCTPWCAPIQGFKTISEQFPNACFQLFCIDESAEKIYGYIVKNGDTCRWHVNVNDLRTAWLKENCSDGYIAYSASTDAWKTYIANEMMGDSSEDSYWCQHDHEIAEWAIDYVISAMAHQRDLISTPQFSVQLRDEFVEAEVTLEK
jgi:hypothetical protein